MSGWLIPLLVLLPCLALSVPVGYCLAWIMDGRYRPLPGLAQIESLLNTGAQNWKQYGLALLVFNLLLFVFGFAVLALQPWLPFAADKDQMLAPTTIFNATCSFLTNTNLQHYSGEVHLTYTSQIFFVVANMFLSAGVGFCALAALIRGLRGDEHMGNFYLDLWRTVAYVFFPSSLLFGLLLILGGVPMTFEPTVEAATVEAKSMGTDANGNANPQKIARGPVAAVMPIKHLGTNGGGFFGANSAHPYENPTSWTNLVEIGNIVIFPFALVVMFGRMLKRMRDALVIYGVMLLMLVLMIACVVVYDVHQPNLALQAQPALPVDSTDLGNLEGKELRFAPGAGGSALFVACTTAITCGSVNCAHDSLNPLAGLAPFSGMWLNCVFGGKGVGLINMLVYLIVAVFLSGLMVGRTPEYLGKKVEAREMKLAMLALLVHPILVLGPTGLFGAIDWGTKAISNPGPHGFAQILYEFSSSSANNGSGFEGLNDTWGFNNNPNPAPTSQAWDIATGLVMLLSRFLPIVAPLALVAGMAAKRRVPFTVGTLRTDTATFACVLLGTILLVGALLFMPAAMLGPVAEHLGPIPFGR
jgi:K+-transporting ATPase ATPase A chain